MTTSPSTKTTEPVAIESDGVADIAELLNSGVVAHQNRQEQGSKSKAGKSTGKNKKTANEANTEPEQEHHMMTHEEYCEKELREAHEKGFEDPDFDFRNEYFKGQQVYYVRVWRTRIKEKRIIPLKLRTLYPRCLVGCEDKGQCVCMGYQERDQIFTNIVDANNYFESIDLPTEEPPKKRRSGEEEEDDGSYEYEPGETD